MKTKTQFKQYNIKNAQPKKDNKKAKRVLLLLIITIIFSFILTVANTLAFFVHVFKDKPQEGLTINTQEQRMQTIAQYEDGDIVVDLTGLYGITFIGEQVGYGTNIFTLTDRFALLISTADQGGAYLMRTTAPNDPHYALGNVPLDIPLSGFYNVMEGYVTDDVYFTLSSYDYAYSLPLARYPYAINVFYEYESNVLDYGIHITVTLDYSQQGEIDRQFNYQFWLEWENSENDGSLAVPYLDWTYIDGSTLLDTEIGHHIGYGFSLTDFYIYANSNANENIAELRRQIQQLQNSTQQQVQDAYNQGRLDGEDIGYRDGYRKGQDDANTYTFSNVIGSLIDGPVNAVMSLFDFEVLGVNLRGFFLSLITCALVIAIVKIFL